MLYINSLPINTEFAFPPQSSPFLILTVEHEFYHSHQLENIRYNEHNHHQHYFLKMPRLLRESTQHDRRSFLRLGVLRQQYSHHAHVLQWC